jgi:hypothetical protein
MPCIDGLRCRTFGHTFLGAAKKLEELANWALGSGPMTDARILSAADFEAALRELAAAVDPKGNIACLTCEACEGCRECTFCVGSKGLAGCHYCTSCVDCVDCSHCTTCSACSKCQHCVLSQGCIGSAYLVRSTGCSACNYCFGCVGVTRRDFCILNEPYDRATYFEVTARLSRELRIAMPWP